MLAADGIDVFWGTRHVLPKNAAGVALVATLYDFWYERFPGQQPLANRTLNRAVMRDLMSRGDVFTAISEAAAADARALFPASADRVRTVLLGLDREAFLPATEAAVAAVRQRLGLSEPFVLAMEVHNPRKNFSAVLEATALGGRAVRDASTSWRSARGWRPRGTSGSSRRPRSWGLPSGSTSSAT